ncbi:MAG: ABC transporter permease [Deltaproteobacteria bacterium]|nr:MAG: ABC transporter permease [Deltaproteobacteria bacterium]
MRGLARLRILFRMAWRNLFNHKAKNTVVGLLMAFGAFLVVVGTSTLASIESAMTRSVTGSVAGHLQVYSDQARDQLALFGGGFMGASDVGTLPDFSQVKTTLLAVDNVKAVVPMGIDVAEFYTQTELDHAIESLRKALDAEDDARVARMEHKIRSMATLMAEEFGNRRKIMRTKAEIDEQLAGIRRATEDAFWQELRRDPVAGVTFLDTKLAPLVDENEGYGMQYIGTDLDAFVKSFDRFELVQGTLVPSGQRGMLVNQHFYDNSLRNRVARMFDRLRKQLHEKGKTLAGDPLLQNTVKRMVRQYRRITFQLEPEEAETLERDLKALLPEVKGNLDALVQAFLDVNDANFDARYAFFQEKIVPHIELYLFDIGDVITIRSYTRSGYPKSVNLKVYGTFTFHGLEESVLAGAHNLMDIMTFRDLYGVMTDEKRAELAEIKAEVGLADVKAENAEDALFGEASDVAATPVATTSTFDELAELKKAAKQGDAAAVERFTQDDIDHGLALNVAVLLKDPSRLEETWGALYGAIGRAKLGLQVVDWRIATGMVGQFVSLAGVVLYVALIIIFIVAIFIMNNTMVMATIERATEIGTMRAIGSRRLFILGLFFCETVILGAVAGVVGGLAGYGFMAHLGNVGIPAPSDELIFLFSGPRLFPTVDSGQVLVALALIVVISVVATLFPAWVATRIQPIVAMQAKE